MLDGLRQDLYHAVRTLRASAGLSAVAIASLALGIGANTAIFSLIDALILKSLPVSHPEQLLQVMMGEQSYEGISNPTWEHLRDQQDVFSGIFAYGRWGFNLFTGGEARMVHGNYVSGQYFETLGVRAILGRTLAPADDRRGCPGSAVLSYGFWQREYGGHADVLGRTISIDRHLIEIVGVTAPGFNGTEVGGAADVMVPLCAVPVIRSGDASLLEVNYLPVGWLYVIGRLRPGVSASQATARLKVLAPQIYRAALDREGAAREDGRRWRPAEIERYLKRTFDYFLFSGSPFSGSPFFPSSAPFV
ncbi:MAG TPA: ABC transporter permease [Bryobacteraceae bacterium]|nr:ABC transporter permease [Bryobacteraceae bacterium]